MKRVHQLTAFAIAAALVLGGAYQFTRQPADAAVEKPAARAAMAVSVTGVSQVGWPRQISASGSVTPWQEAVIAAETGGLRIVKVAADVGDVVKRGQTLVELSRDSVAAAEAQQRAMVDQARAAIAAAGVDAEEIGHGRCSPGVAVAVQSRPRAVWPMPGFNWLRGSMLR